MPDDITFDGIRIVWDDELPADTWYLVPAWLPELVGEAQGILRRPLTSEEILSVLIHHDFRQLL